MLLFDDKQRWRRSKVMMTTFEMKEKKSTEKKLVNLAQRQLEVPVKDHLNQD